MRSVRMLIAPLALVLAASVVLLSTAHALSPAQASVTVAARPA